jgi:hypothetical protein
MHLVVSWDIKQKGKRWTEINNAMLGGIAGFSWLRLLPTFYILEISFENEWLLIQNNLLAVADKFSHDVNFLMSPISNFTSDYFVYHMPEKEFSQGS